MNLKLAFKDLKVNVKRYMLITIIIILLMFMVLFLSGLVDGLGRAVSSGIEEIPADYFVLKDDAECLITVSSVSGDQYEKVKSQTKGEVATLDIFRTYIQKDASQDKTDITYFAIEPEKFLNPQVYDGDMLTASGNNWIVLDDDFKSAGIKVGDTVLDAASGIPMQVAGFTKDQMYGHISVGFISVDTYTLIMKEINPTYQQRYHALVLKEPVEILEDGLELYTKEEIIEKLPGYQAEQMTIKMVDWMLVVITAVIIGIFFFVINIQKEKEFGVLKAIGISMGEIAVFILCEIGAVAVFGALVAGLLVGMMQTALPGTMPFYLQAENVVVILCVFVFISLVGSLLSIVKVAKIDPAGIIGGDN